MCDDKYCLWELSEGYWRTSDHPEKRINYSSPRLYPVYYSTRDFSYKEQICRVVLVELGPLKQLQDFLR